MLEELFSEKDAIEKKRLLRDEYEMVMTEERRIQLMCNWSENISEQERIDASEKLIKANATKKQIISYGFTENEYVEAENIMSTDSKKAAEIDQALQSLVGAIPYTDMSLEEMREERLKKYENIV